MFARLKTLFPAKPTGDSVAVKKQADEHLRNDRPTDAAALYRQALAIDPDYLDACVGLGFALSETRAYDEAERWLHRALSLDGQNADAHYILGTIAKIRGDRAGSIVHFERALEIKPDFEFAYRELFNALFDNGETKKAGHVLDRALQAFPDSAEFRAYVAGAHVSLGNLLEKLGRTEEAIASYRRAIAIDEQRTDAHQYLGNALLGKGVTAEAVACYRRIADIDPENPVSHLIDALSGGDSDRASTGYVQQLFDQYAQTFDSHLVDKLRYNDPEKLTSLLLQYRTSSDVKWTVLDLGCGTGLAGAAIAPHAREIVGVDLSANMLDKARTRGLYARLVQQDLLAMMRNEASASYDLMIAADVLVYLGKLDELMSEAQRLLRPHGLLAFSVESLDALRDIAASERVDYRLNATGRYAHSIDYLNRVACGAGFDVLTATPNEARIDKGQSVQGYLVVSRRNSSGADAANDSNT